MRYKQQKKELQKRELLELKFKKGELTQEELHEFRWGSYEEYLAKELQATFGLEKTYNGHCCYCAEEALFDTGGYISDHELYKIVTTRKVRAKRVQVQTKSVKRNKKKRRAKKM
jgi:hypothetical protein